MTQSDPNFSPEVDSAPNPAVPSVRRRAQFRCGNVQHWEALVQSNIEAGAYQPGDFIPAGRPGPVEEWFYVGPREGQWVQGKKLMVAAYPYENGGFSNTYSAEEALRIALRSSVNVISPEVRLLTPKTAQMVQDSLTLGILKHVFESGHYWLNDSIIEHPGKYGSLSGGIQSYRVHDFEHDYNGFPLRACLESRKIRLTGFNCGLFCDIFPGTRQSKPVQSTWMQIA